MKNHEWPLIFYLTKPIFMINSIFRIVFGITLICSFVSSVFAQKTADNTTKPSYEAGFLLGSNTQNGSDFSSQEWDVLTKGYTMPYTGFNNPRNWNTGNTIAIQGLKELNGRKGAERKMTPMFGFRIGFTQGILSSVYGSESELYRIDTLTSSATGHQYFIDSFAVRNYSKTYEADQFFLSPKILLHFNRNGWVSFSTGLQLNVGISLQSKVVVESTLQSYMITSSPYYNDYPTYDRLYASSTGPEKLVIKQKTNVYYGLAIPLGLDVRLGKKENVFGKTSLGIEASAGVSRAVISGVNTQTLFVLNGGISCKYRI